METELSCVEIPVKPLQKPARVGQDDPAEQDESKYVDLDLTDVKTSGTNVGDRRHCPFGGRNQMSVLTDGGGAGAPRVTGPGRGPDWITTENQTNKTDERVVVKHAGAGDEGLPVPSSSPPPPRLNAKAEAGDRGARVIDASGHEDAKEAPGDGAVRSGDHDPSGKSESDDDDDDEEEEEDDVSLVLSDDCVPNAPEDESHYITTHEIQLCELSDHEGDYELGVGSSTSWDLEDENRVYAFVDYAPFGCDAAAGGRGAGGQRRVQDAAAAAAVSTLLESDLKPPSSDESASKPPQPQPQPQPRGGTSGGQIHLSISATSRAINDPGSVQERGNIIYHARRSGDMSRYVLRGVDGTAETLRDRAKCFIAAPGRVHFGGRLRGKEVAGYSSGASSAVSELDDADKEVRNLTARAFKSLAYPYLDAFNFSTSSESSASEHGLGINRWSTFVDLKYGNVNVAQGLDQSVVSHQNATASFEIGKSIESGGYKGSIKSPTSKILTLSGDPRGASSSAKKIELMGKFSQAHSGVIRLTETLNFRCNVKSGMSGGERRSEFAQDAAGSRSADEVTDGSSSGQGRGAGGGLPKSMEDAHKKAIFASSLIKNVISKKMQFEKECRMERGEIREPRRAPSPCAAHHESDAHRWKGGRELQRHSSRFSESGSDYAITCVDELGDLVDSDSRDAQSDSRGRDAPETSLEDGSDPKKGAADASRGTLLRSQNSAFRCWKDEELEFQRGRKSGKTQEDEPPRAADADQCAADCGKATKMSHLFVPSIQLLPSDGADAQRGSPPRGDEGSSTPRRDDTLHATDSRGAHKSRSPEIKINLARVRDGKAEPFGVSKLRAPSIGCSAARTDDFKAHALAAALKGESADKVPHFMVRDIRDNKGKLQTPIHQVRDVRKLVKSSYHFVSLDNNEHKSSVASVDCHLEPKKPVPQRNLNSVSPIVIKCQSVNTNSNGKQCGDGELCKREPLETDRSSPEGARGAPALWAAGKAAVAGCSENGPGVESKSAAKKQEKVSDAAEKKSEWKPANQVALEKLQAAVKTMEQLYVFERNEWKRKNEPQPLTDSHVLSLLEEDGARVRRDSYPNAEKTPPPPLAAASISENPLRPEDKDPPKDLHPSSSRDDGLFAKMLQTYGAKNAFSPSSNLAASAAGRASQPNAATQTPFSSKHFVPKSPKAPVSLKISQQRLSRLDGAESKEADGENYLTIPVKSHGNQPSSAHKTSVLTSARHSCPPTPPEHRAQEDLTPKRSSIVMETCPPEMPSATIYHSLPLGMSTSHPQMYCFSPAITPAPTIDPFQATQRRMLLDPTTGNYYLVDTPVQPATKRLFDPETGQYVDVPMPQPPMTPVHLPISPLTLSPAAYGHAYMIYPGFMPTTSVIPARTLVQSQMSMQSEAESGEKSTSQPTEGMYMESPFYMATRKSPQAASGAAPQAPTSRPLQGFSTVKQPVISITSQQGPRIIAPPSFDGTTMSFVVEHR